MDAQDASGVEVLERVLVKVRQVRRRRGAVKLAILPLGLLAAGGWTLIHRSLPDGPPATVRVDAMVATESTHESLAVVVWRDGTPSLVEYSGEDLGKLELSFSLEPVVAFPADTGVW